MAAGNGRKALKVEILGDASGAVRAAKQTELAYKRLDDKVDDSNRKFGDFGKTVGKAGGDFLKMSGGIAAVGAAGSLAISGLALAAPGAIAAIGGIGLAFASQNLAVAGAFGELKGHLQTGMQEATAAFVPLMLDMAGKIKGTFDGLKPEITSLFDQVAPLTGQLFDGLMSAVQTVIPMLGGLVSAGAPLITAFADILAPLSGQLVGTLTKVADVLAGPLAGALSSILPTLATLIDDLVTGLGPVATEVLGALGPVLATLGEALGGVVKELGPALGDVFAKLLPPVQKILDALAPLLPMLADLAGTVLVALADALAPVVDALAPFITQLVDQLKPVFEDLKPIIEDLGEQLGPILADNIETILPPLLDLTEALLPLIPPVVDLIAQFLIMEQTMRGAVLDAIVEVCRWLQDVVPPIFDRFMDGLRDIGDVMLTVAGWIRTAWDWVWDKIEGFVVWATHVAWPAIELFASKVVGVFTTAKAFVIAVWDSIWAKIESFVGYVQNLPTTITNALSGMWEGLKNGFRDAINWIIDRWNNLSFTTPNIPGTDWGSQTISTPDIQRFDRGGKVGGKRGDPMMVLAHVGETILPTHKMGLSDALSKVLPSFNLGGTVGGHTVDWSRRRYNPSPDVGWEVWTSDGWEPEWALRKKQEQEYAALRFITAMQQQQTNAAKSIGTMKPIGSKPAAASASGGGGDIYVAIDITGQAISARLVDHQRRGGSVPYVKVTR